MPFFKSTRAKLVGGVVGVVVIDGPQWLDAVLNLAERASKLPYFKTLAWSSVVPTLNTNALVVWLFRVVGLTILGLVAYSSWKQQHTTARPAGPIQTTPPEPSRLRRTRALLRQAAQMARANPFRSKEKPSGYSFDDSIKAAWPLHVTIPQFLRGALFLPTRATEYEQFMNAEREKRGTQALPESAALFLERAADQLTEAELDPSFLLPQTFKQFREADNWPEADRQSVEPGVGGIAQGEVLGRPTGIGVLPEGIVRLEWHQDAQGLHINASNCAADTIRDFRLFLVDVRKYQKEHNQFVEVPAFHTNGPFVELQLQAPTNTNAIGGNTTLFSGNPVRFDFLHMDPGVVRFQGRTADASIDMRRIQESGIWQASLRCEAGDRRRNEYLLFEWHDIAVPPRPFVFPKSVSKAPPPTGPHVA
jgi:hypothetical protein